MHQPFTHDQPRPTLRDALEVIPEELRSLRQWVVWRHERGRGKVPYRPNSSATKASVCDGHTWATLDEAVQATERDKTLDGVGVVITAADRLVAADLDSCVTSDGGIQPWASKIVARLDSYSELSPSGRGIRIMVAGALPPGRRKRGHFELYDEKRYVTITGNHLRGTPTSLQARAAELAALHAEMFPQGDVFTPRRSPRVVCAHLDDVEVIRRVTMKPKYQDLFEGAWQSHCRSQSEADLSFCNRLVAICGGDLDQADRVFRASGLFREKWDDPRGESTYGWETLRRAGK